MSKKPSPAFMKPREVPELHPATTLTSAVIRNAYVYEDRSAQQRVEEYGKITRQIFRELIVDERPTA